MLVERSPSLQVTGGKPGVPNWVVQEKPFESFRVRRGIGSMGSFHVGCKVENHVDRSKSVRIPRVLVDTGSEHTWLPAAKLEQTSVSARRRRTCRSSWQTARL